MEECPQCKNKLETPTNRLVQDTCGHKKCRVCLLNDEIKCQQCLNNINEELKPVVDIDYHTPVITFQSQNVDVKTKVPETDCVVQSVNDSSKNSGELKLTGNESDKGSKTDGNLKRSYQFMIIPTHITIIKKNPIVYKCDICNKTFSTKSHIKYHQYCNGGNKPFKCETCPKEFSCKSHLEIHQASHTGTKLFTCDICKRAFAQRSKLVRHKILHSENKPFVCQECGKAFKSKESLKIHISTHKGEKLYSCSHCKAKFNNSSNLKKHIVTHTDEKSHMCEQCGKRFKLKWALTVHNRSHIRLRPHKCLSCARTFVNAKDLHRHELIHSNTKAFGCGVCNTEFRRKDNLERHMKNAHPGAKVPPITKTKPNKNQTEETQHIVENPNAIKVITTSPITERILLPAHKTSVINAPLKLAFKTSAFKNFYNIHRDYEPPNDNNEPINVYQKIFEPHSPPSTITKNVENANEKESNEIYQKILTPFSGPPLNYETSFEQKSHAVIKNIKFKLPAKYTNLEPINTVNLAQKLQNLENTYVGLNAQTAKTEESNFGSNPAPQDEPKYEELKPVKANESLYIDLMAPKSVIVNSSLSDVHWRRRTSQHLQANILEPQNT